MNNIICIPAINTLVYECIQNFNTMEMYDIEIEYHKVRNVLSFIMQYVCTYCAQQLFVQQLCILWLQGGDEIDDVFGCVTVNTNGIITVAAIDTYNIAGGERQNLGDGETVKHCVMYVRQSAYVIMHTFSYTVHVYT